MKKSLCIRCGACAEACPVDAVWMDPETHEPIVCLHCGRCTAFCPHECLEMVAVGPKERSSQEGGP